MNMEKRGVGPQLWEKISWTQRRKCENKRERYKRIHLS